MSVERICRPLREIGGGNGRLALCFLLLLLSACVVSSDYLVLTSQTIWFVMIERFMENCFPAGGK